MKSQTPSQSPKSGAKSFAKSFAKLQSGAKFFAKFFAKWQSGAKSFANVSFAKNFALRREKGRQQRQTKYFAKYFAQRTFQSPLRKKGSNLKGEVATTRFRTLRKHFAPESRAVKMHKLCTVLCTTKKLGKKCSAMCSFCALL